MLGSLSWTSVSSRNQSLKVLADRSYFVSPSPLGRMRRITFRGSASWNSSCSRGLITSYGGARTLPKSSILSGLYLIPLNPLTVGIKKTPLIHGRLCLPPLLFRGVSSSRPRPLTLSRAECYQNLL